MIILLDKNLLNEKILIIKKEKCWKKNSKDSKLYTYIDNGKLVINVKEGYEDLIKMKKIDDELIIYFDDKKILKIENIENIQIYFCI